MSPSFRRLSALVLLLAAAVCAHQASTRGWGEAQGPDHLHYRLAPNGLSQFPDSGNAAAVSCRWFPLRGTDQLCQAAPGQESRFTRLTYAYPALQAGAWLSFLATVIILLAGPPAASFTRTVVALAAIVSVLGAGFVLSGAPAAVGALAGLPFAFGGPGLVLGILAPVLAAFGGWLTPTPPPRAG